MTIPSHFIGGQAVESSAGSTDDVIDPSNGETIQQVTLATPDDVDAAVNAAKSAFPEWSTATPGTRSEALAAFARILDERSAEFAKVESRQAGKPIRLATKSTFPAPSTTLPSSPVRHATLKGGRLGSTALTTRRSSDARRSASSGRSLPGTTPCRWPPGRCCPRSPPETPSC